MASVGEPEADRADIEGGFDAWQSLAAWLRAGRLERGLSIADVARTTKIQARILEDLEAGSSDDLPADVFVRGFVRNYARCVGLSEAEALARYSACGRDVGPVASPAATAVAELYAPTVRKSRMSTVVPVAPGSPAAEVHAHGGHSVRRAATSPGLAPHAYPRAMTSPRITAQMPVTVAPVPAVSVVPTSAPSAELRAAWGVMPAGDPGEVAALEPVVAPAVAAVVAPAVAAVVAPAVAAVPVELEPVAVAPAVQPVEAGAASKKRRSRKRREDRAARRRAQTVRPGEDLEIYESVLQPPEAVAAELPVAEVAVAPAVPAVPDAAEPVAVDASLAAPRDEVAVAIEPGEVWIPRMPASPTPRPMRLHTARPSLVIDDADPESASQVQEVRATERSREGRDPTRRTFLPPILLESQDRANRQGGLTLAVIILLIAATLTLSYLMRRPSSGGGGMTSNEASPTLVG